MPKPPASGAMDAILDAAEACFASAGFAATPIKTIGHAAGLNTALIYYYFADKEALYHAVLRRRMGGLATAVGPVLSGDHPPDVLLRKFVGAYVEFLLKHPALPHLMLREILDHDAAHALREARSAFRNVLARMLDVIARGQHTGLFRPDMEPANIVVSILGQVVYAFLAQPLIQGVLLKRTTTAPDAAWLTQFGNHATAFALAALAPPPPRARAARKRGRTP